MHTHIPTKATGKSNKYNLKLLNFFLKKTDRGWYSGLKEGRELLKELLNSVLTT